MLVYKPVLTFLSISIAIALVIVLFSYILAYQNPDSEKVSVYECGFDPFKDSRSRFEVRFFLVAILFIVFDLEISFVFPWSLMFFDIVNINLAYWSMLIFLIALTVGLIYEWFSGGLEWE